MSVESPLRSGADQHFGLIETLRYEPTLGCVRVQMHLARMAASARQFGKLFDQKQAATKLDAIQSVTPLRVRLFLGEDDDLSLTTHAFLPVSHGKVWTVAIAATKIDATNSLLAHKTSLRQTYDAARAEFDPAIIDEVLLTNQHGHLCEGTITNLFVQTDGAFVTPPLADGLLRGVLRQELLETGKAVEGRLLPADLTRHRFFIGNSLRGLIAARLQQD